MNQHSFTLRRAVFILFGLMLIAFCGIAHADKTNFLEELNISQILQDYGSPHANASVKGNPLSIGGQKYEHGIGTHANSDFVLNPGGAGVHIAATVGVDDDAGKGRGAVIFKLIGDGKELWKSSTLRGGDAAESFDIPLTNVQQLDLKTEAVGGVQFCHADWVNGEIVMSGRRPPSVEVLIKDEPVILTPKSSPDPRIHSAKVFGVRPGAPFLYTIAATGDRPMTFSADGLPNGLQLDEQTGRITGSLSEKGEYTVQLGAKNSLGQTMRGLKIICGSQIGLTPAMGWNSWNCFAAAVSADKVKSAADAMISSGLANHGWTYINIDDFWEVRPGSKDPTLQGPERNADGKIVPNPRFPDMKELASYIHSKGLKCGLYSSPGPTTCGGCVASYLHEAQDAQSYADWGFDYLKYDWCSYHNIATKGDSRAKDLPEDKKARQLAVDQFPYRVMRAALDLQKRDILFSFCQYGMGNVWEWGEDIGGNSWRTTGDITDSWTSMTGIGFNQNGHEKYAGPGHFNDPDMLVVGKVGWGSRLHSTHLTPNEQYTHITLWCLLSAPLLIGCDMTQLDDFTLNFLSNDEVLEVDQDPLGQQAARIFKHGDIDVWAKSMEDGSKAVGLFNRGYKVAPASVDWASLGLTGKQKVRDLWRQKDLGTYADSFKSDVPRHGVVLIRVWPVKE